MKKRLLSAVLVIVLALSFCLPAAAASIQNVDITYRAIKINLNGKDIVPCDANGKTVEPFIMNSNGTTYLPLRAIAQALGLDVAWDPASNTVTLTSGGEVMTGTGSAAGTKGSKTVSITYRDIKVVLDGKQLELKNSAGATVEPFIMGGTTYLPLRVVGQALGISVGWDNVTNTVSLVHEKEDSGLDELVALTGDLSGNFSPFFYTSEYDAEVFGLTQLNLFETDREGAVVEKGIKGETRAYNGTDYTYNGIADLSITENADGTVYYDITLSDNVRFSDGTYMDIDDVIFSMYVLADPTYDGISTFWGLPVEGMSEYRAGMAKLMDVILAAGPEGYSATKLYTAEQYNTFWSAFWKAGDKFAQEIVDYCTAYGYSGVSNAAAAWGYSLPAGATVRDFFKAIVDVHGYDLSDSGINYEYAKSSITELLEKELGSRAGEFAAGVQTGDSAPHISGIQKTGDNSLRIVTMWVEPFTLYQLCMAVCPLHYYGDESLYDYDSNKFGFTKGDLSGVKAASAKPLGAGPYTFESYNNGTVTLKANSNYYKGCPEIGTILYKESAEADKVYGVMTGTADIAAPEYSVRTANEIKSLNSNGELSGDVITTALVDNLGYGYVGFCAKNVCVNTGAGEADWGSEASKNLRKAIATVISVYREVSIESYYGDCAEVINYPISDSSWAAPHENDAGYEVAFSRDVNGKPIYTVKMTESERYEAAKNAALGYFAAAGYTVRGGKVVAAPAGGRMSYEVMIGGGGVGDHPCLAALCEASAALEDIGFDLIITDMANFSEMINAVNSGSVDMFAMAWSTTVDPDMYQIYHSYGGSNERSYWIKDAELDELIMLARMSTDQTYRKAIYKECLDIIADWAVEIPMYQRQNGIIFSTERIDISTLTPDITTFWDWTRDIEKLEMN